MSWRNRIGRSNGFRKMNRDEEDYDVPLLVSNSSSRSVSQGNTSPISITFSGFSGCSPKSSGSFDRSTNIAAVPHEIEALSFPEQTKRPDIDNNNGNDTDRTSSRSTSPLSIPEDSPFVAQFDPDIIGLVDEKSDSATATIFDDETTNDGSRLSMARTNDDDDDDDEDLDDKSLKPPSIILEDIDEEKSDKGVATTKSVTNNTSKTSKTSTRSKGDAGSRDSSCYIDEDADAATWTADEIDAAVDANAFGKPSEMPVIEIGGMDLLTERDSSVNQLQEANHLMTFNALVLIQKQKDWLSGSMNTTNGANKGSSRLITMELENLERKIKLLMDNKSWPNKLERKKQKINPLTPSKAFFKSMALIDKSIDQFHKGYLKYMSATSEENHELKIRVTKLVELNAALQEEAARSRQKTATIRNLQKEREDLTRKVHRTEDQFASLLVNDDRFSSPHSPSRKESSKFHSVKAYIQWLETQRNANLAKIQLMKTSIPSAVDSDAASNSQEQKKDTADDVSVSIGDKDAEKQEGENSEKDLETDESDDSSVKTPVSDETCVLNDDLGTKWHVMEENEIAMASKDGKIKSLSATVAGQESSLEDLRAEMKLIKSQLSELITVRNELKSQCELKDSALQISQDRISTLEIQVLETHAQVAAYEEDYEAMRLSFATQKVATKQEITNSHDEVKAQVEQIREEFKEKLKRSEEQMKEVEEDRERVIRDLKSSVEDIEAERDNLKALLAMHSLPPLSPLVLNNDGIEEEKKETDEEMLMVGPPVVVTPKLPQNTDFEQMHSRLAEKATKQAFTIAQLTEENEVKDEQLKSLQEMVEMLLGKRNGEAVEGDAKRQWGRRLSNLRSRSQRSASNLLNRGSQHGGTWHGSIHGSVDGSNHGTWHGMPTE